MVRFSCLHFARSDWRTEMQTSTRRSASQSAIHCAPLAPPDGLIPIGHAASEVGLSRAGLRLLLIRTNKGIRHDGKLYVQPDTLLAIKSARRTLGFRASKQVDAS